MEVGILLHVLLISIYLFWGLILLTSLFFFLIKKKILNNWIRFWIHLTFAICTGLIFQLQMALVVRLPTKNISELESFKWFLSLNKLNILIAIAFIIIIFLVDLIYSFYRLSNKKYLRSIGLLLCDICITSVIFLDTFYSLK